jgi:DNA-binding MarR family transcriptional regulator
MAAERNYDRWDLFPEPEPTRPLRRPPTYVGIHIAYHALNQRLEASLGELGASPSEAVVMRAIRRDPGAAISVIRRASGLKRTTLSSLLRRLERAALVRRDTTTWDGRTASLLLRNLGMATAKHAEELFGDVDDELATSLARSRLEAAAAIAEAALALGRPAVEPDQ